MTRQALIDFCLAFHATYKDQPFDATVDDSVCLQALRPRPLAVFRFRTGADEQINYQYWRDE